MRTILFFDLPSVTKVDKKIYRKFVKALKERGFYMLQESVYVKMSLDLRHAEATVNSLKEFLPSKGSVISLIITEKQFASMNIMMGCFESEVLSTDERLVIL